MGSSFIHLIRTDSNEKKVFLKKNWVGKKPIHSDCFGVVLWGMTFIFFFTLFGISYIFHVNVTFIFREEYLKKFFSIVLDICHHFQSGWPLKGLLLFSFP